MQIATVNKTQLTIGGVFLLIGVLYYMLYRPPEQVLFIDAFQLPSLFDPENREIFGVLHNSLPSFIHGFSFTLLMCALLPSQKKRSYFLVGIFWVVVNVAFELLQLTPAGLVSTGSGNWNRFPAVIRDYIGYGVFDYLDVTLILLGCMAAFGIAVLTMRRESNEN